jgi:hypothetical protein
MASPDRLSQQNTFDYDVFISYSHRDSKWVRDWLLPRLEEAGLRVCIDFRDFEVGVPSLVNMERAAERSHRTLLVLTPNWIESEWTNFEALLVQTEDPIGLRRRILPLVLERCQPPKRIAMLTYADFTAPGGWESELQRVVSSFPEGPAPPQAGPARPQAAPQAAGADMDEEQRHLRELLGTKRRRLQVLEIQEARYGIAAPPHITLEIEDLRREIADLEARLRG